MKKYLIVLLITIIVIISILKISAFSDECIVVDTPYASSLIQISRCDCVCFIMLAIGAQSTTYSTTEQKVICEYETDIVGEEKADLAEKYISRCMFQKKRDLVHQAARYLGIINGEYRVGENERYIFFNTYRTVRLDECLAFIVRCLEEDKAVKKSLEETFEMAKDYGLILESDYFYDCPKKELMLSDLRIILERFIDNVSEIGRSVICIGTGNEGASGGHFSGRVREGRTLEVEFAVASYEATLNLQIWKNYVDRYRITVTAPLGEQLTIQEELIGQTEAVLGYTRLLVYVGEPKPYTTDQEIYIDFLPQRSYVDSGIWTISIEPREVKNGYVYMYLPGEAARSSGTRFVSSSPEDTLTIPSTASKAIAVGAYNSVYNAYADFSGRGYMNQANGIGERQIGSVRPTLVAPGVSLQAVTPGGTYQYVSGTSFATPVVTGSAALLMEWGIVQGQDVFLYGEKVKANLIRGARRFPVPSEWPNAMYGWGALCVEDSIDI